MAAAEYFSNAPMGPTHQSSPYQRPQYVSTPPQLPQHPPPPYQSVSQEQRPTVHFADSPQRPQRNSFSSHAPIPVWSESQHQDTKPRPNHSPQQEPSRPQVHQTLSQPQPQSIRTQQPYSPQFSSAKPQPYTSAYPSQNYQLSSQNHAPKVPQNPQFLSPYMQPNQSQYAVNGYSSDPEPHRRRRRRHSNDNRDSRRHDRDSKEEKSRKERSRSTNADGFLGAAGGGLIGDLIFPGLGTVGGAVAGWIGGKDYGKHRKYREERLDRNQEKWEQKHRRNSDERVYHRHDREQRSYERHKYDY